MWQLARMSPSAIVPKVIDAADFLLDAWPEIRSRVVFRKQALYRSSVLRLRFRAFKLQRRQAAPMSHAGCR